MVGRRSDECRVYNQQGEISTRRPPSAARYQAVQKRHGIPSRGRASRRAGTRKGLGRSVALPNSDTHLQGAVLRRQPRSSHRSSPVGARRSTPQGSQIAARGRRRRTPGRVGPHPDPFPPSSSRPRRGRTRGRLGPGGIRDPGRTRGAPPATPGCVVRRLRRREEGRRIGARDSRRAGSVRIFPAGVIVQPGLRPVRFSSMTSKSSSPSLLSFAMESRKLTPGVQTTWMIVCMAENLSRPVVAEDS
jgi:hypothetical protein